MLGKSLVNINGLRDAAPVIANGHSLSYPKVMKLCAAILERWRQCKGDVLVLSGVYGDR